MLKRNTVTALILCAFAFTSLSLPSANGAQRAGANQPSPQITPGVPVKDVEVKLTRYGGAQFSAGSMSTFRATTNEKGEYKFQAVPKGEYLLTVEVSEKVRAGLGDLQGQVGSLRKTEGSDTKALLITISDASGKRGIGWDLGENKPFDPTKDSAQQSTARAPGQKGPNIVVSDGATPCNGIVKSRSNIKTN